MRRIQSEFLSRLQRNHHTTVSGWIPKPGCPELNQIAGKYIFRPADNLAFTGTHQSRLNTLYDGIVLINESSQWLLCQNADVVLLLPGQRPEGFNDLYKKFGTNRFLVRRGNFRSVFPDVFQQFFVELWNCCRRDLLVFFWRICRRNLLVYIA